MPHVVPVSPPEPAPDGRVRPGAAAQVAGVVAFPVIGGVLAMTGTPVGDVLALVCGCGVIGAGSVVACVRLTGWPVAGRLVGALAAAAVRAAQESRT